VSTRLAVTATPWLEADALFRSDPRWLGSDDAYSVDLQDGRTLWLFGDTFIDPGLTGSRREAHFIRNSIGIQTGSDPSSASIDFHWGHTQAGEPRSFFEAHHPEWLWPLDGRVVDGVLHLCFMKVRSPSPQASSVSPIEEWRRRGPLGFFDVYDWHAVIVRNFAEPVDAWKLERVTVPDSAGIICGAALLRHGQYLLSYGWKGRHGFLCRWPAATGGVDISQAPEWWDGRTWTADPESAALALARCTTEFTVHQSASGKFIQLQVIGIQTGDLEVRWSDAPEGPWSDPYPVYRAPESERAGVFVYAAKAHMQLSGAPLVCTYASNGPDVDYTLDDLSIYYPRFVRLDGVDALVDER